MCVWAQERECKRFERVCVCVCVCVCACVRTCAQQQETRQGNHSHSFRSIRFSVSQSVRPLTDTLGFLWRDTCTSTRREKQALAHVPLTEVSINKTNQTKPVMTLPLKIICAEHSGRRSIFFFLDRYSSPKGHSSRDELFSAKSNPVPLQWSSWQRGKVPDYYSYSDRMREDNHQR